MVAGTLMTEEEAFRMPPLTLAYVGDAVWEINVRTFLVMNGHRRPDSLHKLAVELVRAGAQAYRLREIQEVLTERERDVIRRGRNAKSGSIPKNARVTDYRASTGFEAMLGYLFLTGQTGRLQEIIQMLLALDDRSDGAKGSSAKRAEGSAHASEKPEE